MTVAKVTIERHETRSGWFRMTIVSLSNFLGETKFELLLREESLRAIRNQADRAISNKANLDPMQVLKKED